MNTDSSAQLGMLRLLQLVSPALPVGAYSYSQTQEYAVEAGWIGNEEDAGAWIQGVMAQQIAGLDLPVLVRLYRAWETGDQGAVDYWNRFLLAARESRELQAEDKTLALALARLLAELEVPFAADWRRRDACFANLFALAASHWRIELTAAASGYAWAWLENQVAAAIKLVPLGQTAGQRILSQASARIPALVDRALDCADDDIGQSAPGLAMASAWHEQQYTRLFRS